MACNCINYWNKQLKEIYNDSACVNYALMLDGTERMVVTGYYYPKKRDGLRAKKPKDINLYPKYCPFCGQPYNHEVEE